MADSDAIVVRGYQPHDAPALWHVFHDAVHHLASACYTAAQCYAWAPDVHDALLWQRQMDALQPFVVELGGAVAGYADVQPDGCITHCFVASAHARRGVRRTLMQHIGCVAAAQNLDCLHAEASRAAEPFFAAHGFEVVRRQSVRRRGIVLDNAHMVKRMAQASGFAAMCWSSRVSQ